MKKIKRSKKPSMYPLVRGEVAALILFFLIVSLFVFREKVSHMAPIIETKSETLPDISKTLPNWRHTRDSLISKLAKGKPATIFDVVDAIQSNPSLALNCHDIAHDFGHSAYEMYGFTDAMAFTNPERTKHAALEEICAGGYIHGILEEAALHQTETGSLGSLCNGVPKKDRDGCFHGIGHAIMFSQKRNVPASLDSCRTFAGSTDRYRCFEGVWMEEFWGNTLHAGTTSLGWNATQPFSPCTHVTSDAKASCYLYAPFGYLRFHPKDYQGAVHACTAGSLSQTEEGFCLRGIGITVVNYVKGSHFERAESFVSGLTQDQKYSFYQGLLGYALLSGIPADALSAECSHFSSDKDLCVSAVEEYR